MSITAGTFSTLEPSYRGTWCENDERIRWDVTLTADGFALTVDVLAWEQCASDTIGQMASRLMLCT